MQTKVTPEVSSAGCYRFDPADGTGSRAVARDRDDDTVAEEYSPPTGSILPSIRHSAKSTGR